MYDDYRALVGRRNTDFKSLFVPGSEMLAEDLGIVTMASSCGDSSHLLWKIWIPAGTKCLQATMYVYWDELPAKVLMRYGQPPTGGVNSITPENAAAVDLDNVLAMLLAGAEVPYYAQPKAGNIKLSNGSMDSPVLTHTGNWMYLKALQVPGDKIYSMDVRVTADATLYKQEYANIVWDEQGNPVAGVTKLVVPAEPVPTNISAAQAHENYVYGRVVEEGLIPALSIMSGKTGDDLVKAAVSSGTWAALLRLIK